MDLGDLMDALELRELTEITNAIAQASAHDQANAKLITVIDQYYPDPPPAIRSWSDFEEFWEHWYPDGLLELNRGRVYGADPNLVPQGRDAALVKMAFVRAMYVFLGNLQEDRLGTLNELSGHQWALTRRRSEAYSRSCSASEGRRGLVHRFDALFRDGNPHRTGSCR